MSKRILLIQPDGSESEITAKLSLKVMQRLLGGYVEHVNVLDKVVPGGDLVYTSMFVNETGLTDGLPRNQKATEIYQRNVRHQFAGHANPFKASRDYHRKMYEARGFVVEDIDTGIPGYDDDPYIAGPALYFEGYTVAEVDDLLGG